MKRNSGYYLVILFLVSYSWPSHSADLAGQRTITLSSAQGENILIGSVTFIKQGNGFGYDIKLDETKFADHFLSMRPFKCLEGKRQYLCHLPYPYDKTRHVSPGQFTDLEHEFLFIHKKPTDYGIDMWNGLYYVISETGDGLAGRLHELDMDILASPPEEGVMYPLIEAEKMEGEAASHWMPFLRIE